MPLSKSGRSAYRGRRIGLGTQVLAVGGEHEDDRILPSLGRSEHLGREPGAVAHHNTDIVLHDHVGLEVGDVSHPDGALRLDDRLIGFVRHGNKLEELL